MFHHVSPGCTSTGMILQYDAWYLSSKVMLKKRPFFCFKSMLGLNLSLENLLRLYWGPGHPEAGGNPAGNTFAGNVHFFRFK